MGNDFIIGFKNFYCEYLGIKKKPTLELLGFAAAVFFLIIASGLILGFIGHLIFVWGKVI